MIKVLPETHNNLLAVLVTEKLTNEDFDQYRAMVKERMTQYGSCRLYFEMQNFSGWVPGSFIENAIFDLVHGREYGRVAMVGEKTWQEIIAKMVSPIKREGVKYFDISKKEEAMAWVKAENFATASS